MNRLGRPFVIALFAGCALLSACLTAGPGACGPDEREFFEAIDHFDAMPVEPEDHPLGICGAVFTTDEPADAVVEHYAAAFAAAGWDVSPPDEVTGGEPGMISGTTVSASRDTYQYHVEISEARTGEVHVNITAGNADQ